jgi:predicted nucleic acid-binding protein
VLVLDAAAVVDLLLRNEPGRTVREQTEDRELWTVAHLDAEVFSAMSRLHRDDQLTAAEVEERVDLLASLPMDRLPISAALLSHAWALRENVAARDALYVAAAQMLDLPLLTTDRRLARAVPGSALDIDGGE